MESKNTQEIIIEMLQFDEDERPSKSLKVLYPYYLQLNGEDNFEKINELISEFIKFKFSIPVYFGFLQIIKMSSTKDSINVQELYDSAIARSKELGREDEEIEKLFGKFVKREELKSGPSIIIEGDKFKLNL